MPGRFWVRIRRFCVCGFRVNLIADFNRIVCCVREVLLSNIDKLCQRVYPWNYRTSEVSPLVYEHQPYSPP